MTFEEKLQAYAELTAGSGVAVTSGKYVLIHCAIEAAAFGRMVERECYKRGAKDVIMIYNDQKASRIRYEYAALEQFQTVPEWRAEQRNYYAREGCVSIHIIADDPEAFAGVSGEKMRANTLAGKKAFQEFYDIMDKGGLRWTIVAYPCPEWARKVFPNESSDADAVQKLWDAIFTTVRIGEGDVNERWRQHDAILKQRAERLNAERFKALRYRNSLGTDLTVGLAEGHIWKGGSEKCREGVAYFPNMPTEEIFTMPDCRYAEGRVCAALPLSYHGDLIEGFWLEFRDGKVVDYGAEKGIEALRTLLNTDEGSLSLGEAALIPYHSPIAGLGILFYETLFDENASCHLALGDCYPDTMRDGEKLTRDELKAKGGNESANHVDFMIGTADMSIVGIHADGSETPVFIDGDFAF